MGIPGVKDIRSQSMFGFSTIYVVFEDGVEFYWSRSRMLEKLNSLPAGTLPPGVTPALGPDATALGQVFWYTLEGRDAEGNPTGGWDPHELRSIQDFIVKYKLAGVEGVAEVASIGGFVQEYQVDVEPRRDAGRGRHARAGHRRGPPEQSRCGRAHDRGQPRRVHRARPRLHRDLEDLEQAAVTARDGQPILVGDIAKVSLGPALRRGVLTKAGEEAVGGVVVVRHGENPMATIQRVKDEDRRDRAGAAEEGARRRHGEPRHDRALLRPHGLIKETLQTLNSAITQQVLVTIIVVVVMVMHLRTSLLISAMLPDHRADDLHRDEALRGDANIVALSGIAIAIGTIVDMGIVLTENILRRLDEADRGREPPRGGLPRVTPRSAGPC